MDAVNDRLIQGEGTSADAWRQWQEAQGLPAIDVLALVPPHQRAVVVAPHPDDEVLGCGGLMAQLSQAGRELVLLAATDGEASHPGSQRWPAHELAQARPRESAAALAALGVSAQVERLGLPDGGLAGHEADVRSALMRWLRPGDVVFAPWRLDGHPDHEAVARAAIDAARANGAHLVEVPIWGWHWCTPGDPRMPWQRARAIALTAAQRRAKEMAVRQFHSQVQADPSTGQAPILPAHVIARLVQPTEVVLT